MPFILSLIFILIGYYAPIPFFRNISYILAIFTLIFAIIQWYSIGKYRESLPYLALNSMSDGVIAVNLNGKIVYINSVAEKLMNIQSDSVFHKDVSK